MEAYPPPENLTTLWHTQTANEKEALAFIRKHIKPTDWQLWSDGSEDKLTGNGGAGGYIKGNNGNMKWFHALVSQENNYAELIAIYKNLLLLDILKEMKPETQNNRVIIFTDSQNAMNWILNGSTRSMYPSLTKKVRDLVHKHNAIIVKVKGHAGIPGNEAADKMAGIGTVYCNLIVCPDENYSNQKTSILNTTYFMSNALKQQLFLDTLAENYTISGQLKCCKF